MCCLISVRVHEQLSLSPPAIMIPSKAKRENPESFWKKRSTFGEQEWADTLLQRWGLFSFAASSCHQLLSKSGSLLLICGSSCRGYDLPNFIRQGDAGGFLFIYFLCFPLLSVPRSSDISRQSHAFSSQNDVTRRIRGRKSSRRLKPRSTDSANKGLQKTCQRLTSSKQFPYALSALPNVLATQWDSEKFIPYHDAFPPEHRTSPAALEAHVRDLTARDVKASYHKNLQGYLWEDGYASGAYATDLFADVVPKLKAWRDQGRDVAIYSSGSVFAQKLLMRHVKKEGEGTEDLEGLVNGGWFDTVNAGFKAEGGSYEKIAGELKVRHCHYYSSVAFLLTALLLAACP